MNFLIILKNSLFGLVAALWGLFILISTDFATYPTLQLMWVAVTPLELGLLFMFVGIGHCISRFIPSPIVYVVANILLSLVFLLATLSHLYISFYSMAWFALFAIVLNLIINAYLIVKSE